MNASTVSDSERGAAGLRAAEPVRGRSLGREALARLVRNRAAVAAMVLLALIGLLTLLAPWLSPHDYEEIDWDAVSAPPSWETAHLFGTDALGRDLLARTLHGGRISLLIGLLATAVSVGIGVFYGAVAGFAGGRTDGLMMRVVDILYSLPFMFFVILLMVLFGRHIFLIFIAVGAVEWLSMARIVRGQTLALKHKDYVEAARACGLSEPAILRRHIVPNTLGPVVVYMTLTVPQVILFESFLSFLGLGVQEPDTSWGVLISEGARQMESAPWTLVFPALFLAATLFALNFIGDGLRDALDPHYH